MKTEKTHLIALAFGLAAILSSASYAQQSVARCNLQVINPAYGGAYMEARASVVQSAYWTLTGSRATANGQADFAASGWVQPSQQRTTLAEIQLSGFYSNDRHTESRNSRIIRQENRQRTLGRRHYDVMIIAKLQIYNQNNQIICERSYSRPNQGPHDIFGHD